MPPIPSSCSCGPFQQFCTMPCWAVSSGNTATVSSSATDSLWSWSSHLTVCLLDNTDPLAKVLVDLPMNDAKHGCGCCVRPAFGGKGAFLPRISRLSLQGPFVAGATCPLLEHPPAWSSPLLPWGACQAGRGSEPAWLLLFPSAQDTKKCLHQGTEHFSQPGSMVAPCSRLTPGVVKAALHPQNSPGVCLHVSSSTATAPPLGKWAARCWAQLVCWGRGPG